MTDPPLLGALVAGWPAFVLDVILNRYLPPYLAAMTPQQRAEVERAHQAIGDAARLYDAVRTSVSGSAEAALAETAACSEEHEITTAAAALLLGLTERRVCQLAAGWADDGFARKVGRTWLLQREAVIVRRQTMTMKESA